MRASRERGEHGTENASSCSGPNGEPVCCSWDYVRDWPEVDCLRCGGLVHDHEVRQ